MPLRISGKGDHIGTVEPVTNDGLIIWIKDDLNERRLFHVTTVSPCVLSDDNDASFVPWSLV